MPAKAHSHHTSFEKENPGRPAKAAVQNQLGFDKTLTPSQLTPYKINWKMKIKKAQNYQWDPNQVHL